MNIDAIREDLKEAVAELEAYVETGVYVDYCEEETLKQYDEIIDEWEFDVEC